VDSYGNRRNGVVTHQNFFNNKQVGVDSQSFAKRGARTGSSYLWIGSSPVDVKFNVNTFVGDALKAAFNKPIVKSGNPFAVAKNTNKVDLTNRAPFQEAMEIIAGLSPNIIKELECAK
jgi:small ligand-binding sensory domain FIST